MKLSGLAGCICRCVFMTVFKVLFRIYFSSLNRFSLNVQNPKPAAVLLALLLLRHPGSGQKSRLQRCFLNIQNFLYFCESSSWA